MEFTQGGNPIQWVSRTRLDLKTGIGFDIKDRERCTSAEKVLGLTSKYICVERVKCQKKTIAEEASRAPPLSIVLL